MTSHTGHSGESLQELTAAGFQPGDLVEWRSGDKGHGRHDDWLVGEVVEVVEPTSDTNPKSTERRIMSEGPRVKVRTAGGHEALHKPTTLHKVEPGSIPRAMAAEEPAPETPAAEETAG